MKFKKIFLSIALLFILACTSEEGIILEKKKIDGEIVKFEQGKETPYTGKYIWRKEISKNTIYMIEENYKKGILHGEKIVKDSNGYILRVEKYRKGILDGKQFFYNLNNKNLEEIHVYENGSILFQDYYNKNEEREKSLEYDYKKGNWPIRIREWDEIGKLIRDDSFSPRTGVFIQSNLKYNKFKNFLGKVDTDINFKKNVLEYGNIKSIASDDGLRIREVYANGIIKSETIKENKYIKLTKIQGTEFYENGIKYKDYDIVFSPKENQKEIIYNQLGNIQSEYVKIGAKEKGESSQEYYREYNLKGTLIYEKISGIDGEPVAKIISYYENGNKNTEIYCEMSYRIDVEEFPTIVNMHIKNYNINGELIEERIIENPLLNKIKN